MAAEQQEIPRFLEAPTVVLESSALFAKRAVVLCTGLIVASLVLAVVIWLKMSNSPSGQVYLLIALLPTVILAIMIMISFRASKDRKPVLVLTPKGLISSYNNFGTVPWDRIRFFRVYQDSFFPEIVVALTEAALKERPSGDAAVRAQIGGGYALRIGMNQIQGARQEILDDIKPYLQAFSNEK